MTVQSHRVAPEIGRKWGGAWRRRDQSEQLEGLRNLCDDSPDSKMASVVPVKKKLTDVKLGELPD
ncbi:hypothetical protein QTO34_001608 [Cnephaeus nilssonii]|uniref:Uncharacterized protein n=1 Tax=Cnephaeus nilssonii TaxID=3371016 RepID=A0AA40LLU2_CNENI|nr:hypothetical protein QTO34_001608 [Eptesicus nilssonii]